MIRSSNDEDPDENAIGMSIIIVRYLNSPFQLICNTFQILIGCLDKNCVIVKWSNTLIFSFRIRKIFLDPLFQNYGFLSPEICKSCANEKGSQT